MLTRFVQALESRTFLSASPVPTTIIADELAVAADIKAFHADLKAYGPTYKADVKALKADLEALPKSEQNALLLNVLRADQNKCAATLRADFAHLMAVDRPALHKLRADGLRVFMHPTDAAAKAALAADITAFQSANAAPLATFMADLTACTHTLSTDVAALVAANPTATKLASDLQKAQADVAAAVSTIQNDLSKTQADLGKLTTDLSA